MTSSFNDGPIEGVANEQAVSQDHLALIYNSTEEKLISTVPLIKVGLEKGELCLYISDLEDDQEIIQALEAQHIDVEKAVSTSGLILTSKQEVYFKLGRFDPDWTIQVIKNVAELAVSYGFTAMRIISDMRWTKDNVPGVERWPEYEVKLCTLNLGLRLRTTCLYDREAFSPQALLYALKAHPKLVSQGAVYDNMFFIPPERLEAGEEAAAELEGLLTAMKAASLAESELASRERMIRELSERLDTETRSRSATEASLEESRARFWSLCERSSEWFWELGPDGTYTYSSPRVKDLLGLAAEDVLGRRPEELVDGEDAPRIASAISQALADRTSISALEKRHRNRDGHIVHLEMSGAPVLDRNGALLGYRGMDKDVTGRKASKKAIDEHRSRIDELISEMNARDLQLRKLEEEVGQLRGSLGAKENMVSAISAALEEKEGVEAALHEALKEKEAERLSLVDALKKKDEENLSLLEAIKEREAETGRKAEQISVLTSEIGSLTDQLQQVREASAIDKKEMERQAAQIELLRFNLANMEDNIEVIKADYQERLRAADAEAQAALAALRSELTTRVEEVASVRRAKSDAESELGTLMDRLRSAMSEAETVRKERDSFKEAKRAVEEELRKRTAELSAASEDLQRARAEADELRGRLADMGSENSAKDEELARLRSREDELIRRSDELSAEAEALRGRLAGSEAVLTAKDEEIAGCRAREEEIKASLTSREMEIGMLRKRADEVSEDRARLLEDIASKDKEIMSLQVQLAAANAETLAARNEMAELNNALAESGRELGERREQLRALLRQDRVGVARIDLDGRLLEANAAFHSLLGQEPGAMAGAHYRDHTHRDDLADTAEMYRRLRESGGSVSMVKRYVRKHGGIATVALTLSSADGADGKPSYLMALAFDRTEEAPEVPMAVQAPALSARGAELARRLNDALTVIAGSVTLAKEYVIPEGRMYGQLSQIERASREAARLAAEMEGAPSAHEAATAEPAKLVPGRGRILLVDNDEAVLETTTHMLRHLGYDVEVARDGEEASAVCRHAAEDGREFALAIIDAGDPSDEKGRAIASRLMGQCPGLRTMVSSGQASHPALADPADWGFIGALPRPYTLEDLSRAVGVVLQGKA